jgi:xanthine dehydrogenase accessory factor
MNPPALPRSHATTAAAPVPSLPGVGWLNPAAAEPAPTSRSLGWLKPLRDWPRALLKTLEQEAAVVRILVTQVLGSAPREAGVCMLIGREQFQGTIGGGQLEWQALAAARLLLAGGEPAVRLQRIVLASDAAQCCGGVVELWMQRYTRADRALLRSMGDAARRRSAVLMTTASIAGTDHQGVNYQGVNQQIVTGLGAHPEVDLMLRTPRHQALPRVSVTPATAVAAGERATLMERLDVALPALWLYGAGHVGQALARIVADLPLEFTWIDPRAHLFPDPLPDSVRGVYAPDPLSTVTAAAAGTRFIVLTHSHALDYALCRAILLRGDFGSLGLIGSMSKGARFRSRLARDGVSAEHIARLQCPIGAGAIASKWPAAIAVAVAFDLLGQISCTQGSEKPASRPVTSNASVAATSGSAATEGGPAGVVFATAACAAVDCASCRVASGDVAGGDVADANAVDGNR